MDKERLPRKKLEWCPPGRPRNGKPRNSWMQEVTTGMREKGIVDLEWVDREGWRKKKKERKETKRKRKKKTLGAKRNENMDIN